MNSRESRRRLPWPKRRVWGPLKGQRVPVTIYLFASAAELELSKLSLEFQAIFHPLLTALVTNPATALAARSLVRTADPTDRGLTVGPAVRTDRRWPK